MAMYDKFLKRLQEIREYEWNDYDLKIWEEDGRRQQKGVRPGEGALEAIARNMVEVLEESPSMIHGKTNGGSRGKRV